MFVTIDKKPLMNKLVKYRFIKIDLVTEEHSALIFVVCLRTAKKCTKSYNARAQLLFC